MLSKRQRPYDPAELAPGPRLKCNVRDLVANNVVSGKRCQELLNDMSDAGASGLRGIAGKKADKNSLRNIKRHFLKRCQWPPVYWAQVRVISKKSKQEELQWIALLLPHEIVEVLCRLGDPVVLRDADGLDDIGARHLADCRASAGDQNMVGIGIWGDGVPCNWDRTESIETISMNLPGQAGKYAAFRVPLTGISKKQIGKNTWDDVLSVIHWSLVSLAAGVMPSARHDGAPFRASDSKRQKMQGQAVGMKGALVEVRGDWKFFGEVFHLPKHNENSGCCWRCTCTPQQVPWTAVHM